MSSAAAAAASLCVELRLQLFFAILRPAPWHAPARPSALHFPPRYRNREREPSLSVSLMAKGKKAKPAGE